MKDQESITKTKQERIKRAPERYNEDGTDNNKPKDPVVCQQLLQESVRVDHVRIWKTQLYVSSRFE